MFEVGGTTHLAHGDRHPRQLGIMDVPAREDIGKCTPDHFANAKLPLRGAGAH